PPPPPPQAAAPLPPPPQAAPPPPPPQEVPPMQQPYPPPYPAAADPYQQQPYPPPPYPPAPYPAYPQAPYPPPQTGGRVVDVHPMQFQSFDSPSAPGEAKSIDLVYNIPLQVSVELGRAKKEISEILEFSLGTIIVLDKIAGDPVEIVVNGRLIAKGEVVVIDENYGVRITDIVNS
ncbi:MAG: flagellar motor switch protein FliN, partial [Oscillospiraceae bacterium]|nr:flagellar motor switch protein FliN [Oscillospiraceae bacterium]